MTIEDQLHDTFLEAVAGLEQPDRWQEIVTRGRRRRRNRRIAALGSGAIALSAALGIAVALVSGPTTRQVKIAPTHGGGTAPAAALPNTTRPAPTTAAPRQPAATPSSPVPSSTATPSAPPGARSATTARPAIPAATQTQTRPATSAPYRFGYVPLYPFATQAAADAWLAGSRTSGVQPWHKDPKATALAFTAFLGYTEINKITESNISATQARVSVGYLPTPSQPHTAAVIHLVRYGPNQDAPWEVVGTDDQPGFTITSPAYGSAVRSPMVAGGRITGVDESITVQIFTLSSSTPVGRTCCRPAGGIQSPWTIAVPITATPSQVLIVSAATGGHVAGVERFVVTGVRN